MCGVIGGRHCRWQLHVVHHSISFPFLLQLRSHLAIYETKQDADHQPLKEKTTARFVNGKTTVRFVKGKTTARFVKGKANTKDLKKTTARKEKTVAKGLYRFIQGYIVFNL